jgi:hypothetical protein
LPKVSATSEGWKEGVAKRHSAGVASVVNAEVAAEVSGEIHYTDPQGVESVVARINGMGKTEAVEVKKEGHYRLHVTLIPRFLEASGVSRSHTQKAQVWIISNPIHVTSSVRTQ